MRLLFSAFISGWFAWSCAAPAASSPVENTAAQGPARAAQPPEPARTPFSGEIVYRQTAFANDGLSESRDLGNFHYFISGSHWKHVDESGDTTALYDPETNLVHYFKPERKTVNAGDSEGPVRYELLPDTTVVLGRTCKAYRQTSEGMNIITFYDPALFVEPKLYTQHRFRHWGESLAFSGGGLTLASRIELRQSTIVSEAISIQPRSFEPSFWSLSASAPKDSQPRSDLR